MARVSTRIGNPTRLLCRGSYGSVRVPNARTSRPRSYVQAASRFADRPRQVIDGDTIVVAGELHGINAPELDQTFWWELTPTLG